MAARVVCISRTLAAGGETVGRLACERLGFRYLDDEIVGKAAEKAGVDISRIVQAEHKQSFLDYVFDAMGRGTPTPAKSEYVLSQSVGRQPYADLHIANSVREEYRTLIREVIAEVAAQGNAVIVAHAASMALAGNPEVLRVLITASLPTRVQRVWLEGHLLNEDDATKAINDSDRERADYLYRFYQVREELPTHYDLVVNTDHITLQQAVDVIVHLARS